MTAIQSFAPLAIKSVHSRNGAILHQPVQAAHPNAELRRFHSVSTDAAEELEDENLSILDLENILLTGQILQRQRDAQTREVKFVVGAIRLDGEAAEAIVKVGFTGKLVVITAYLC